MLTGTAEPGGRLPTTWPATLEDCPVTAVTPVDGKLIYDEGLFIGYRAWDRIAATPAYAFGHGLGYTNWEYEGLERDGDTITVRLVNTGTRAGREVVQAYVAPVAVDPLEPSDSVGSAQPDRPARALAGFATVEAGSGESVTATIAILRRAFEAWDEG